MKCIYYLNILLKFYLVVKCSSINVKFHNKCSHDIWISKYDWATNWQGIPKQTNNVQILPTSDYTYQFPDKDWAGLFIPKYFCDTLGQNCLVGGDTLEWFYPGTTQMEFILPIASTKLIFSSRKFGLNGAPLVDYYLDINYGFSVSMSVTPSIGQKILAPYTYCKPLAFNAFPCPTVAGLYNLGLDKYFETWSLVSKWHIEQCLSPCALIFYPDDVNEFLTDNGLIANATQAFCCNDFDPNCVLKGTDFLKNLRLSGSSLVNDKNGLLFPTMSLCDTSNFDVVVSCGSTAPSPSAKVSDEFLFTFG